jgi:hypothetical protein
VLLTAPQATNAQTMVTHEPGRRRDGFASRADEQFWRRLTADVARSATDGNDQATYLKFNRGGTTTRASAERFCISRGSNVANNDTTILHVYAIKNDSWTESGINWSNAPDLLNAADSKLLNVGERRVSGRATDVGRQRERVGDRGHRFRAEERGS